MTRPEKDGKRAIFVAAARFHLLTLQAMPTMKTIQVR